MATVKPATHRLLAAGRGVYGHSVLGINSDYPGTPVLVEVDSGPLAHDRLSGSFERKDERLVIKFDKLMIGDSDPLPVSAYAVAPDTMETGLASEVQEHLATRIFLPAAAAFVEGLGNAMQNSNTNSVTSGLGVSSFTHLTLPQQLAVGAGRAGQEMGQLLQKQTPQNPTVLLHKDDPIGVIFTDPVDVP
ncbi:DotG/IcmE/VirB10 family protein [Gluconobacter cerinus]|nr:DotG/IcmE/VirB10 family protein [Gluconobacter cerinus]MBS1057444.1 DotG/IcmE/VirB10 family protein [Gluconobacter kondonii]